MKLVYIIGPLRASSLYKRIQNIRTAEKFAIELWSAGFAVICPHLNTGMLSGVCPEQYFLNGDIEMLRRCDFAFALKGWQDSIGSRNEVDYCNANNIKIWTDMETIRDYYEM